MTRNIELWRAQNVGRVMFAAADQFVRDSLRPAHQNGFDMMSVVLLALTQNLDRDGTRLTTIAQRARMTKASMMELVNKAQALGLVERQPDPADKRAKIVSFTPLGLTLMALMRQGLVLAERRLLAATSRRFVADMKVQLMIYAAAGTAPVPQMDAASAGNGTTWRTHHSSRVLLAATDRFVGDILQVVHDAGFVQLTPVLLTLFRNLDRDGTRLTEIAARAKLTKQAMAELVAKGAAMGLVEKCDDPSDQRAKIILFTAAGHEALDRARDGVMYAEAQMARVTAPHFVPELMAQLLSYVNGAEAADQANVKLMSAAQRRRLACPALARP